MAAVAQQVGGHDQSITATLAQQASALQFDDLPGEIVAIAKQCLLDWFAVTLAGASEPLVSILCDELAGTDGAATLVGVTRRANMRDAALINGAASHALDFDDVNLAMNGHPTAPLVPALLALAEATGAAGRDLITAFVAGYETECRIGQYMSRSHYDAGFHATGTTGSFGAAAAAARLLDLDAEQTAIALGIAGTQAAGLKSMFGTMCKPLHAGKAALNGLLAARLAQRGFTARPDVLETKQGFADTQAGARRTEKALAAPRGRFHLRNNLFKYHAACYLTHSPIEALSGLRQQGIAAEDVEQVTLQVDRGHLQVCNIEEPATGLETKFSLRHTAAFALAGVDTAALATYSDDNARRDDLVRLRRKVTVAAEDAPGTSATAVVRLADGRELSNTVDVGIPAADVAEQGRRIAAKYLSLASPVIGRDRAEALQAATDGLDTATDVKALMQAAAG